MAIEPISPDGVIDFKKVIFPDEVIDSFNKVIAKNFRDNSARFNQNELTYSHD